LDDETFKRFEREAEDFRTGPEIAADFRDFINENPDSSYSPNMRAFIFGKKMASLYSFTRIFDTFTLSK